MWIQLLGCFLIDLALASIKMLWHRRKGEVGLAGHASPKADGYWIFVSCEIKYYEADSSWQLYVSGGCSLSVLACVGEK